MVLFRALPDREGSILTVRLQFKVKHIVWAKVKPQHNPSGDSVPGFNYTVLYLPGLLCEDCDVRELSWWKWILLETFVMKYLNKNATTVNPGPASNNQNQIP